MNEQQLERLVKALERIGAVLGVQYAQSLGNADLGQKAHNLTKCGFSNKEIADILGTNANNINVALHYVRHQKPKKTANRKSKK